MRAELKGVGMGEGEWDARTLSAGKAISGIVIGASASLGYAWAFAYTHPAFVWMAMSVCFALLTLPIWFNLLGRPFRRLRVYYLGVASFLVVAAIARFPVEALLASGG